MLFLKKYDAATTAVILATKSKAQDELFAKDALGFALEALLEEKKATIKKGDAIIQKMENDLIAKLDALQAQGTLTAPIKRELNAEVKAAIAAHKETDIYKDWVAATGDDYNERIAILRETLEDDFLARVKAELTDYPIFMAIAEDIGYDATGRPTATNELETVAAELARFLAHIERGDTRPFVCPPDWMRTLFSSCTGGKWRRGTPPTFIYPDSSVWKR